jgi:hypothetical protein
VASGFLALAGLSLGLPEAARRGIWLPVHLALPGAAGTAIAALLPFFSTALRVAPPAGAGLRIAGLGLIAGGAGAVTIGWAGGVSVIATGGGVGYLLGIGLVAIAAFRPLRLGLGPRRRLIEIGYAAGLLNLLFAVSLATTLVGGSREVAGAWAHLKPAHAWLGLVGCVAVVIATTLVHLGPTVAGTRIRPRSSAVVAVALTAVGAPIVAVGYGTAIAPIATAGCLAALLGALALTWHGLAVVRAGPAWTTDAAWHRLTSGLLTAAPAWLCVGIAILAARILDHGVMPASWSLESVAAPLALGFVVQALVGSWSHLIPAIGPGQGADRARARRILGWAAIPRIVAWNLGVAVLALSAIAVGGLPAPVVTTGAVLVGVTGVTHLVTLGAILSPRHPRASGRRRHPERGRRDQEAADDRDRVGHAPDADRLDDEQLEVGQPADDEHPDQAEPVGPEQPASVAQPPPRRREDQDERRQAGPEQCRRDAQDLAVLAQRDRLAARHGAADGQLAGELDRGQVGGDREAGGGEDDHPQPGATAMAHRPVPAAAIAVRTAEARSS